MSSDFGAIFPTSFFFFFFTSGYEKCCLGILIPGIPMACEDDSTTGNKDCVRKPRLCNECSSDSITTECGEWNLLDSEKNQLCD